MSKIPFFMPKNPKINPKLSKKIEILALKCAKKESFFFYIRGNLKSHGFGVNFGTFWDEFWEFLVIHQIHLLKSSIYQKNSHFENLIFHKIHILKTSIYAKIHISKINLNLSQNSHFENLIFPKNSHFETLIFHMFKIKINLFIQKNHILKILFLTKFTFRKNSIYPKIHIFQTRKSW